MKEKQTHVGVYGILLKSAKILLINKSTGPYLGKWDLPGGEPQHGEPIKATLLRTVIAQTGVVVKDVDPYQNFTHTENYKENDKQVSLYQIGMFYFVSEYDDSSFNKDLSDKEVKEVAWIDAMEIDRAKLTPFALKVITNIF